MKRYFIMRQDKALAGSIRLRDFEKYGKGISSIKVMHTVKTRQPYCTCPRMAGKRSGILSRARSIWSQSCCAMYWICMRMD